MRTFDVVAHALLTGRVTLHPHEIMSPGQGREASKGILGPVEAIHVGAEFGAIYLRCENAVVKIEFRDPVQSRALRALLGSEVRFEAGDAGAVDVTKFEVDAGGRPVGIVDANGKPFGSL